MSEVLFYHLEKQSLDDVLPGLIERTLARGWRALQQGEEGVGDAYDGEDVGLVDIAQVVGGFLGRCGQVLKRSPHLRRLTMS